MTGRIPALAVLLAATLALAVTLFMLAPLVVVMASSLSASEFLVFPPRGFSLRWYRELLNTRVWLDALGVSLTLALCVTAISVTLGAAAAIALSRPGAPFGAALTALFLSPLMLPEILLGIGLLTMATRYGPGPSFAAMALGHVVVTIPYVVRTVCAVLSRLDPAVEEAARVMGAPWWRRYQRIVLPQAKPGLAAGAFFAFNISFDEAVVALFLRSPGEETLPLLIYSKLEFSPDPSVAAAATLMIVMAILVMIALDRILGLQTVAT